MCFASCKVDFTDIYLCCVRSVFFLWLLFKKFLKFLKFFTRSRASPALVLTRAAMHDDHDRSSVTLIVREPKGRNFPFLLSKVNAKTSFHTTSNQSIKPHDSCHKYSLSKEVSLPLNAHRKTSIDLIVRVK